MMKTPHFSLSARFFAAFLAALAMGMAGLNAAAEHNTPEALEARISPEGRLNVVAPVDGGGGGALVTAAAAKDGETVYTTVCAICHDQGIAGAPKTGDAAVWEARIAQGMAVLVEHAIFGFQGETGVMIAKGGNPALSDDEVKAAVEYMVELSQ